MKISTKAWVDIALRDIKLSEEIVENEYYSNIATFHCQQSIEKLLKAFLEEYSIEIPKTHNLIRLHSLLPPNVQTLIQNYKDSLNIIDKVYIDSRYPSDMGLLPSGLPTKEEAKEIFAMQRRYLMPCTRL